MAGILTISLDFELHWGVFDKKQRDSRQACYKNTLSVIPQLLKTFSENDIHVTWATVGALFLQDEAEWLQLIPSQTPSYSDVQLSAYRYAQENGLAKEVENAHFAKGLVSQIPLYLGQELATHTYSHYYCLEPGQTAAQFEADLQNVIKTARNIGQEIVSLVFPRNQFNGEYLKICYQYGIKTVRSNPNKWYWKGTAETDTSLLRKFFRTGDSYLPLGITTYPLESIALAKDEPIQLPASRFLRPYHPRFHFLNTLRLNRILDEMTFAARKSHCYHLWWHPENFGDHPSQSLATLSRIVAHYNKLKQTHGMESWNMKEYSEYFNK